MATRSGGKFYKQTDVSAQVAQKNKYWCKWTRMISSRLQDGGKATREDPVGSEWSRFVVSAALSHLDPFRTVRIQTA